MVRTVLVDKVQNNIIEVFEKSCSLYEETIVRTDLDHRADKIQSSISLDENRYLLVCFQL